MKNIGEDSKLYIYVTVGLPIGLRLYHSYPNIQIIEDDLDRILFDLLRKWSINWISIEKEFYARC